MLGSECVEWGRLTKSRYPFVNHGGRTRTVHRVAYEKHNGPIPSGMCVLHSYDNTKCVNPDHLFLGTQADNMRDRDEKGRNAFGERNGSVKLKTLEAEEVKRLRNAGVPRARVVGMFRVSESLVSRIHNGRLRVRG